MTVYLGKRRAKRLINDATTHRAFCREIVVPDGDLKGQPLDPDIHPAQREYIRAVDAGYRKTVLLKPAQDGGSLITSVPILKRAVRESQTCILAYPTLDKAKSIFADKWQPVLAGFGGQEFKRGGGSRGGVSPEMRLPGGGKFLLRKEGGRGEASSASDTADASQIEEVDDWRSLHRVKLFGERLNRAADPFQGYVSTLKKDTGSIILGMWEDEACTQSVMEYPCHSCGAYHWPIWDHIDVDREVYVCPHCQADWSEIQRLATLNLAKRHDERPSAPAFSLRWTALESPFTVLVEGRKLPALRGLCALFRAAKAKAEMGEHGPMRSFYHDRLTLPYTKDLEDTDGTPARITPGYLAARSKVSTYALNSGQEIHDMDGDSVHIAHKPQGVEFLVVTQDVQQGGQRAPGRNYFHLTGWTADRRSWDLAWGHLVACPMGRSPSEAELHGCLQRIDALASHLATEYGLPILRRGVDVGDRLPEIRRWLARNPQWLAIRGVEATRKAQPGDIQGVIYRKRQEGGWILYELDVHEMRQRAQNGFLVPPNKPGAAHIPEGLAINSSLFAHYCATALIPDAKSGLRWSDRKEDRKLHGDWQKRHDLLDCRTYGYALAEYQIRDLTKPKPPKRKYGSIGAFGI